MCLAIPGKVTRIWESDGKAMAEVDFGGVAKEACLDLVPGLQVGEYTIVHLGFALRRMDEADALLTIQLFEQMGDLEAELGSELRIYP